MKLINLIVIAMLVLSLLSCVLEPSRPDDSAGTEKKLVVNVDADIEEKFNLALSHLKNEEYDTAILLLEQIIADEKRVPAPFINLGMAYNNKGELQKAEENFLLALKIDLTNPVANNQLGLLYRKKGRFDDAKKAYTNALTEYPDNLAVLKNLGILCELYMRDLVCALEQYEHYLSLQPDDKTMKIWVTDLGRRVK